MFAASDSGHGVVVLYSQARDTLPGGHEALTHRAFAERLAAFRRCTFAGEFDPQRRYEGPLYFLPNDTLTTTQAQALGIRSERDLFGGVVPQPFMATKTITHPLIDGARVVPQGWTPAFGERVREAVLPGFSAFDIDDACRAGAALLKNGPARVKLARGIGGLGQKIITRVDALREVLTQMDARELAQYGVAIEENLADIITYSVGHITIGRAEIAYYGTQSGTPNNRGAEVYGGSALTVVRGGFAELLALQPESELRCAIEQSQRYDAAAEGFPGFMASRRNYDVLAGSDSQGQRRCGVLEQSWRVGGASSAELAAFEVFAADPNLRLVRAACVEFYGEGDPPPDTLVYFRGNDARVGLITKYCKVQHGNAA